VNNLNSILVEGEVVADPVIADGEALVAKFTVLTRSRNMSGTEEHAHLDVLVANDPTSRICRDYLRKGRKVRVIGRLATSEEKDGAQFFARRFTYILAEHVEFKPQRFTGEETSVGKPAEAPSTNEA
jgi:single-stranded DNA-binding protein